MGMFLKDPDARLDYRVDWSGAVGPRVGIAASSWHAEPAGGLLVEDAGFDGLVTACWIAGGRAGHSYRVTNRVVLDDGATEERTILVRVETH